jgi:hypothetical protein
MLLRLMLVPLDKVLRLERLQYQRKAAAVAIRAAASGVPSPNPSLTARPFESPALLSRVFVGIDGETLLDSDAVLVAALKPDDELELDDVVLRMVLDEGNVSGL